MEILTRGVANIIPGKKELEDALESGKKMHIYLGIDPTATKIHLGHTVPLRKLQELTQQGHQVTFLIGDFTALIGDTSDKDTERPVLTPEQIHENFRTYKTQAEKIIDFSKIRVVYNSEWLGKLSFEDIVKLCQHFSVGDFVGRELIRKRLAANKRVGLHEMLYPVMQGYDSYFMDTDLQIGGTDQTFNMQAGRELQKDLRGKESFVLTTQFLMGTDGRKMSKSWGNAIWLDDTPEDMYRKVMAIADKFVISYYTLATNIPMLRITGIQKQLEEGHNPMQVKKALAHQIVTELHSVNDANQAAEIFEKVVQKKELPNIVPSILWNQEGSLVDFLVELDLAASRTDAKRLIEQGGITIDGKPVETKPNEPISIDDGQIVAIGKKKFVRVKRKE